MQNDKYNGNYDGGYETLSRTGGGKAKVKTWYVYFDKIPPEDFLEVVQIGGRGKNVAIGGHAIISIMQTTKLGNWNDLVS